MMFNIAADMVVNGSKNLPRIGITTDGVRERHIPCRDELIWLPHCWSPNENTEYYYRRLVKMHGDLPGGFILDDHSLWEQTDLSREEFRTVARSLVVDATEKTQGNIPGHLRSVVEQLDQPQIPWPALLRRYLNQSLGQRRTSYSRRHRRRDEFGVPGITRRRQAHVSVIVDVSGSVSHKELGQFFGEMEKICTSARTDVLLWDCEFQGFTANYCRGNWETFSPDGGGGTDMAAPVEWLVQRKLVGDCIVILTDGFCNWPVKQGFGFIAVISGAAAGPAWGRTVYLAA
jgi:predicted metal-dependent peptidase